MNKKSIAIVAGLLMAGSLNSLAIGSNNTKCQPFKIPVSTIEKAKYEGLKSIKNFKMKNGVELVPFYDAHHCRYAVYWQK